MLKSLSAYIKIIAAFLIFSAFVEIILPDTKFRKYILMVCGLIMVAVMIKPLFTLELEIEGTDFQLNVEKEDYTRIAQRYEKMHKDLVMEIHEDINSNEEKSGETAE